VKRRKRKKKKSRRRLPAGRPARQHAKKVENRKETNNIVY